jgi:hypothetical protein
MTLDTQMPLALLQELLLVLRANDVEGFKRWGDGLHSVLTSLEGMWLLRWSLTGWDLDCLKQRMTGLLLGS